MLWPINVIGNSGCSARTAPCIDPVRFQRGGAVVDEQLALPHLDAIAGQADDALDPGLRAVARPAEHDDIAALRGA
jgi:hypothetical protein